MVKGEWCCSLVVEYLYNVCKVLDLFLGELRIYVFIYRICINYMYNISNI